MRRARDKGMGAAVGLQRAVIEGVWIGDEGEVVVAATAWLAGARSLWLVPAAIARV